MYSLKGKRPYQEDCGFAIEYGETVFLAVADGFNKPPDHSGLPVSKRVVKTALQVIGDDPSFAVNEPTIFLDELCQRIHNRTKEFVAGSTFSMAIIDRTNSSVTLGTVGDSIVALTDHERMLRLHPIRLLEERHIGLASAFGDSENGRYHAVRPHIAQHALSQESVLIISSDGLYPVEPENNVREIRRLADLYVHMVQEGSTPQDLAEYASTDIHSPDNITVAIYRAEALSL